MIIQRRVAFNKIIANNQWLPPMNVYFSLFISSIISCDFQRNSLLFLDLVCFSFFIHSFIHSHLFASSYRFSIWTDICYNCSNSINPSLCTKKKTYIHWNCVLVQIVGATVRWSFLFTMAFNSKKKNYNNLWPYHTLSTTN